MDLAIIERRQLIQDEARAKARTEDASMEERFAENAALDVARGEIVTVRPKRGERRKPQRRLTGLELLVSRGHLEGDDAEALKRYGDDYRLAVRDVVMRSCLDFTVRGGERPDMTQKQKDALDRLSKAQNNALGGQSDLMRACNLIAGQQLTPREAADGAARDSDRLVTVIIIAGRLLKKYYGLGQNVAGHTTA